MKIMNSIVVNVDINIRVTKIFNVNDVYYNMRIASINVLLK